MSHAGLSPEQAAASLTDTAILESILTVSQHQQLLSLLHARNSAHQSGGGGSGGGGGGGGRMLSMLDQRSAQVCIFAPTVCVCVCEGMFCRTAHMCFVSTDSLKYPVSVSCTTSVASSLSRSFFPVQQSPPNQSAGLGFDADMLSAESLQVLLSQLNLGADAFAPDSASVASPGEGPQ